MHSAAIMEDGSLFMWGWNKFGQCGVKSKKDHLRVPTKVIFFEEKRIKAKRRSIFKKGKGKVIEFKGKCVDIRCSNEHNLAIYEALDDVEKARRVLFSWGSGKYGRLGHGHDVQDIVRQPKEILSFNGLEEGFAVVNFTAMGCFKILFASMPSCP